MIARMHYSLTKSLLYCYALRFSLLTFKGVKNSVAYICLSFAYYYRILVPARKTVKAQSTASMSIPLFNCAGLNCSNFLYEIYFSKVNAIFPLMFFNFYLCCSTKQNVHIFHSSYNFRILGYVKKIFSINGIEIQNWSN